MSNSVIWPEILFDIEKFNNFSNGQLKDDIFSDDPKSEMNFHQLEIGYLFLHQYYFGYYKI